ncbi:MAG: ABC transporter ATP-binding protein [Clostridia bacterium]
MEKTSGIWRILKEYRGKWPLLFMTILGGLVGSGSMVISGILLKPIIDALVDKNPEGFRTALPAILIFFSVAIVIGVLSGYATARLGEHISMDLRKRTVKKISRLPIEETENVHSGDYVSLFNNDMMQLSEFLSNNMPRSFGMVFAAVAGLFAMFYFNWKLTLISITVIPLFMFLADKAGKPLTALTEKKNESLAEVNEKNQDAIGGYMEIKSFGLYDTLEGKYAENIGEVVARSIRIVKASILTNFTTIFARIIPVIIVIGLGVYYVIQGTLTLGALLAIIQISNVPLGLLSQLGPVIIIPWKKARGCAERMYALLDKPEERLGGQHFPFNEQAPVISFEDVHFSYRGKDNDGEKETKVLEGVSFEIQKGSTVAFVGESGCGKSTILKLMAGYYEHQDGEIAIGGHDIRKWDLSALREHMALVEQETYLFPGSIHENIALGGLSQHPDISPEQVKQASQKADISGFIETLEQGYGTIVHERGVRLSGGQRQRIAIARAVLKDSDILLLDEPTSALDAESENYIEAQLRGIMGGRTVVIVAHRLSTIKDADRIYVIKNGGIAEQGRHDELLAKNGAYRELLVRQTEEKNP